ncbi:MAG TPA: hypothetical protein VMC07_01680, partial [Candidatus Omnitrophota bacterium]|nr:hypothetical protein [Candidatus Omnitrophota bacterium]
NPGHWINETAPPTGCTAGQILQWKGDSSGNGGWACITPSITETDPTLVSRVPYGFGGMYWKVNNACTVANPYTSACNCPSGYNSVMISSTSNSNLYYCYKYTS